MPLAVPVDPAAPANRALDQGDDAFGQAGQLFRLEVRAEGDSRHVEDRHGRSPVDRRWSIVTSVTLVPLAGWTSVPPARTSSPGDA